MCIFNGFVVLKIESKELLVGFAEHLEVPDPEIEVNLDELQPNEGMLRLWEQNRPKT